VQFVVEMFCLQEERAVSASLAQGRRHHAVCHGMLARGSSRSRHMYGCESVVQLSEVAAQLVCST
jgi:hypothetical protein